MADALDKLAAYLARHASDRNSQARRSHSASSPSRSSVARFPEIVRFLRDDRRCRFGCLIDICGVDYPEREERFDVVYHLLSPWLNHRIRVRTKTDAATPVPSIVGLFPGADWFEREAYDLYGILF